MRELLRADLYRMFCKRWFWLCVCFMEALSAMLLLVQRTAVDYAVSLDRVVFLPMSFYGVAVAALVGLFIGDDYFDGMMHNKIAAGKPRASIYLSAQIACWLGCIGVYTLMTLTTLGVGICAFPVNVTGRALLAHYLLGVLTCVAYGSIFCMISMLARSRSAATVLCMASAFAMLFLCLHTNQALAQETIKNGLPNPACLTDVKRVVYLYLHDCNPCGQAAQLSAMRCYSPLRFLATDACWACASVFVGAGVFKRADVR